MAQTIDNTLLSQATATGDGPVFDNIYGPPLAAVVQLEFTGSPAQVVVTLKGLIDGATFGTLAVYDTAQGVASGDIYVLQLPPGVRKIKANLTTLTGGTSPAVSCYFMARL